MTSCTTGEAMDGREIDNAMLYKELRKLHTNQLRMEGKVDALQAGLAEVKREIAEINGEVRGLCEFRAAIGPQVQRLQEFHPAGGNPGTGNSRGGSTPKLGEIVKWTLVAVGVGVALFQSVTGDGLLEAILKLLQ